jgi:hypothetical protein
MAQSKKRDMRLEAEARGYTIMAFTLKNELVNAIKLKSAAEERPMSTIVNRLIRRGLAYKEPFLVE